MSASRQRRPVVLLRPVPGTSVIHELWAGTKIIVVFAISMLLSFYPGWIAIGLMALLVVVTLAQLGELAQAVPAAVVAAEDGLSCRRLHCRPRRHRRRRQVCRRCCGRRRAASRRQMQADSEPG